MENSITLKGTDENSEIRTESGQTKGQTAVSRTIRRLGKGHVDYWLPRIKRRVFVDRHGGKVEVPEWQVRFQTGGRDEWFNLGTANQAAAAKKAKEIATHLAGCGWESTLARFKPRTESKQTITLPEFYDLYGAALRRVEYPPTPQTAARYIKSLAFICRHLDIIRINDLTPDEVSRFKGDYLEKARGEKRHPESVKVSCNTLLRNAGAIFSRPMLAEYQAQGLKIENPFEGQKLRRIKLKSYSPINRDLLDRIWVEAEKLRDGDPGATKRVIIRTGGRKAKRPAGEKAKRWGEPDFNSPQTGAYLLLLLELGLGLRRHEADKAQWDWFSTDSNGRHYIEVRATPYFTPKSKESRIIPVDGLLHETIQATQSDASPFIVPGRLPKRYEPGKEPKNLVYRADQHHRTLAFWLRKHGITDEKPCHSLRKEFGSYVATSFGLFHAQRMLGHSSPKVTADYYAGLTQLPELKNARISAREPNPEPGAKMASESAA